TVEKQASPQGPPRKFFTLNDAGREELHKFWKRWDFMSEKMNQLKEGIHG
ncbi:MAG: PadR family transcriptional regulator, partial [Oscillospiraceae bacterium]